MTTQPIPPHLARAAFEVVAFLAEWWAQGDYQISGSVLYAVWDEGDMTVREAVQQLHEKTKDMR